MHQPLGAAHEDVEEGSHTRHSTHVMILLRVLRGRGVGRMSEIRRGVGLGEVGVQRDHEAGLVDLKGRDIVLHEDGLDLAEATFSVLWLLCQMVNLYK